MEENEDARVGRGPFYANKGGNPFRQETFYNLSLLLARMILLTIFSGKVLLPGNLLMALIILASAFHLSGKFLARL